MAVQLSLDCCGGVLVDHSQGGTALGSEPQKAQLMQKWAPSSGSKLPNYSGQWTSYQPPAYRLTTVITSNAEEVPFDSFHGHFRALALKPWQSCTT